MRIFTYFDCSPHLPNQGELIRQWRDSWAARGWEPKILNPRTFAGHPLRRDFCRAIRFMRPVEKCRLSRWLALDSVGGGWICHYDVINFSPHGYYPVLPHSGNSVIFDWAFSYAHVTKDDCRRAVRHIVAGAEREQNAFHDTNAFVDGYQKHHTQFGDPGWYNGHTVHFGSEAVKLYPGHVTPPKFKLIDACGRSF